MKKLLFIPVLFFSFIASSQFSKAEMQVSGLTCSLCSNAVKKGLENVGFVKEVKVDIKTQQYKIIFKENAAIDPDKLKDAVSNAGFSVAKFEVTGHFTNLKFQKEEPVQINNLFFLLLNSNRATINGDLTLTIIEKDYLTARNLKKYCSNPSIKCLQPTMTSGNKRIYHVII